MALQSYREDNNPIYECCELYCCDERLLLVIGAINAWEIILKVQHQPTRDDERLDGHEKTGIWCDWWFMERNESLSILGYWIRF